MLRRLVLALFILATAHGPVVPAVAETPTQRVADLVNAERARAGLPALTVSAALSRAAGAYAAEMADQGFFSHQGPDGSTFISRALAAGYRGATYLAENIAAGQTSPEQVVASWMASPSHRANILSPWVTEMGVGYAARPGSPYGTYWVLELGSRTTGRPASGPSSRGGRTLPAAPTRPVPSGTTAHPAGSSPSPPSSSSVHSPGILPSSAKASARPLPPSSLGSGWSFDVLGRPLTGVIPDPVVPGLQVQYFQRAVLEWHPENSPPYRIQVRLLTDALWPGADPPVDVNDAPPGPWEYFPFTPGQATGLGHFVADYTRSGQPIYFKDYFDQHGGVATFGYPMEEPRLWEGLWTQRFQAAIMQYHPEYDRDGTIPGTDLPWRYFRVQLRLLGEQYARQHGLPDQPLPSADLDSSVPDR